MNRERELLAVSDVSRKVVPEKGRLNRERPVTKALEQNFRILICFK